MKTRLVLCALWLSLLLPVPMDSRAEEPAAPSPQPFCDKPKISTIAPPPCPNCSGLDIVFVVDQSGSMFGTDLSGPASDPLKLRYFGQVFAARWLGADRLRSHTQATHRISVVDFGGAAQVAAGDVFDSAGWYTIDPGSEADWQRRQQSLVKALGPDRVPTALGGTNFKSGFEAAKKQFDQLNQYASIGTRRKVVVLLTDGNPDRKTAEPRSYFSELLNFASQSFPLDQYAIYVVGMNAGENYWPDVENCWQKLSGLHAQKVASNDEVGSAFQTILYDLTADFPGVPGGLSQLTKPGPVIIPPYLQSITFSFFKSDPAQQLVITDANQSPIACGSTAQCLGTNEPIESMTVFDPLPGQWNISTDQNLTRINVTMLAIPVSSHLSQPTGIQVQYVPTKIEYTLADSQSQPLPTYANPQYRLNVQADVRAGTDVYTLTLSVDSTGAYVGDYTPLAATLHSVHVRATTQDLAGQPITVFDADSGSFDVSPVLLQPITLPQIAPQYLPLTMTFGLFDKNNNPITVTSPIEAKIILKDPSGVEGPEAPLTNQNGIFVGQLKPQVAGPNLLHLQASLTDPLGQKRVIEDKDFKIEISPTTLLKFAIVQPAQPDQDIAREWWFQPRPLVMAVQLLDENNQPVEPSQVLKGDPNHAFEVAVVDEKLHDRSADLTLSPTGTLGGYSGTGRDFGIGVYTVTVKAALPAATDYAFDQTEQTITITRIPLPWQALVIRYGPWAGAALALVLLAFYLWDRSRRNHPALGELLLIENTPEKPIKWRAKLDDYHLNHIPLVNFPGVTNIRRMDVYSDDKGMTAEKKVRLVIRMTGNPPPFGERGKEMGPRDRETIGGYTLIKDPSLEDRLPQPVGSRSKSRYSKESD